MKKQVLKIKALMCLIGISMIWYACQKESGIIEKYEVSFNILSKSDSDLKNSEAYELNDAEKVIITIQENDGTPTDYTQYELNVNKLGDACITKKIALQFGSYKVTEFYIIDALDSIIFASPLEGSLMAQNVADPLPIFFDITEKLSNAVNVEVISTEKLKPEDFGLIRFPIIEIETFQFLINVSELGTDQLLIADLTVTSDSYSYSQVVDSVIDNIVTIKDGYANYILIVESSGYQSFVDTLTNVELIQHTSIPFIVELEPIIIPTEGLVAYFPFNGNALDESNNGHNGIVYGPILAEDRHNNTDNAYYFDGVNDYILIDHSEYLNFTNNEFTISAWINLYDTLGSHYAIVSKNTNYLQYGYLFEIAHNRLIIIICDGSPNDGSGQQSVEFEYKNSWHHVACVFSDPNNLVHIYIDGVIAFEDNSFEHILDNSGNNGSLSIGSWYNGDPHFWNGMIDEVRLYNRVLNDAEILALFNN